MKQITGVNSLDLRRKCLCESRTWCLQTGCGAPPPFARMHAHAFTHVEVVGETTLPARDYSPDSDRELTIIWLHVGGGTKNVPPSHF